MNLKKILINFTGRGKMRTRLILTYTLGIVLPLLILGMLFIDNAGSIVEGQLIAMAGTTVEKTADQLDTMLQRYTTLADQYVFDAIFMQSLRRKYVNVMDAYDLYTEIWSRRRNYLLAWPDIRNITIYTENKTLVSTSPFVIRSGDYISGLPVYERIQQEQYAGLWSGVRKVTKQYEYWNPANDGITESAKATFTYNRTLKTGSSARGAEGMITLEIYDTALTKVMTNGMADIQTVIVDDQGNLVFGEEFPDFLNAIIPGESAGGPEHMDYSGKNYLLWKTKLRNSWTLLSVVTMDVVAEQANRLRLTAVFALVALAALAMAAIWLISSIMTERVRLLVEKMHRVDNKSLVPGPAIGGNDEISELDRAFIAMTERLTDSVERQYSAEVKRKEAELDLLHTQINPHFLHNMLSSLAWLADSRPGSEVRAAIESLAGYYRITLARGREIITLREELTGLAAYMELQRLRFSGRVRCLVEIDEALLDTLIPRLTLQPLVENSITHGSGPARRPVSLVISASVQGDMLRLVVQDDGVGMDAERLEQLEHGEITSVAGSGLGYRNVAERIRLHFGDAYGLKVRSQPGAGTTVEVLLPLPDVETAQNK